MKIEEIDKNFEIGKINKPDIKLYAPNDASFKIYGIKKYGERYLRMPEDIAKKTSEGVHSLNNHTAGGRIRFKTNSSYIALFIKYNTLVKMDHFALTGSAGADLYVKNNGEEMYLGTYRVNICDTETLQDIVETDFRGRLMEYTINLPTYSGISELFVGVQEDAVIEEPTPYTYDLPIVFYGSSITQGACCSRPGNAYQAILSRRFDFDFINLGFSGSAKAEDIIVDYMAKLPMSVFVLDYDYNAPNAEELKATHEKAFLKIRKENPDIPIIILSAPCFNKTVYPNERFEEREEIVSRTYKNAIKRGDKNVYYVDGKTLMKDCEYEGTADNCHPNDFGFYSMANAISKVLEKILY